MRTLPFFAGAALATTLLSGTASATLIDLGGYTGAIQIKFQNYESFTSTTIAPGVMNFGVIAVTSISDPVHNSLLWFQGKSGQYLSAVFNGITVSTVTPTVGGFTTTNFGGTFRLWLDGTNFDPGQGTGGYAAGGCAVPGNLVRSRR